MGLSAATIVRRDLPAKVGRVELRVRVGAVPIAGSTRAEHHAATLDGTLVHLAQMNGREVDLEGTLITERLEADITLDPFLAGCWVHELGSEVGRKCSPLAFVW